MHDLSTGLLKALWVGAGLAISVACTSPLKHDPPAAAETREPLFENLGTLHYAITTRDPAAQRYFDQGLRLVFAFNHEEAIRSFEQAARIDPGAAMAYWGIALALGPNINAPMDRQQERRAYAAVQQARAAASNVTPRERALIEALMTRYSADEADRKAMNHAYAEAMRTVARRFPDDSNVATLFAEALMNVRPWDYWTADGRPNPGTEELLRELEAAIARSPEHIGACHYYIHAVEAWQPERALPCAERLPGLAPGAGHLVHMPAHIYMRLGMYGKAAERNVHAVSVDQHYLEGRHLTGLYPVGYYPHNLHFLWAARMMEGRSAEALRAADDLIAAVPLEAIRETPELEEYLTSRMLSLARFGRWEDILRTPPPPLDLAYTTGLWRYTRGLAMTATGEMDGAAEERGHLDKIIDAMPVDRMVGLNAGRTLLQIASRVLGAESAARRGRDDEAVRLFEEAVQLQDGLRYAEPPAWYYPVRHSLGAFLLALGRPADAAHVYREDLRRHPENAWSLFGLAEALRAQGAEAEAAAFDARFQRAWSRADLMFRPSQFDAFLAGREPHRAHRPASSSIKSQ